MPNAHFGNLADVFKHLALTEVLGAMRPMEYWESHAGSAVNAETAEPTLERQHGVHTFMRVAPTMEELRLSLYARALSSPLLGKTVPAAIPGSPFLARLCLAENIRRMLFCDVDAESLGSIRQALFAVGAGRKELGADKIECVADDGISILRGAGVLLPESWTSSTLAFLDPYEMRESTDAGITPLELACELASRTIVTLLFYTFSDETGREERQKLIMQSLEKSRLMKRAHRFEGALACPAEGSPTQWGFGMLAINLRDDARLAV
ncbi:MAG TPA: hypothetical protein VGN88_13650, partial [Phycisphaerae bacterium]